MKKYLLIFFFSCIGLCGFGQNPAQIIAYADRLFEKKEYTGAVQFYETAMNIDSSNVYLLYKYALSLKEINQLNKAGHYLEKVVGLDRSTQYPMASYELAEVYYKLENYRQADRYYRRALRPYRRNKESPWYKRITQKMSSLDFANNATASSDTLQFYQSPNINTFDSEFSPFMLNDTTLLFSSLRADSLNTNNRIKDKDYYSRIYKSIKKGTSWTEAQLLPASVNLPFWDVANPAFDGNSNYLYFSKCDTLANCEIWRSKYINGIFHTAESLNDDINLAGSNNTQPFPSLLNGKEVLFFVSDRPGGMGSLDIWYAEKGPDGNFGRARNLGNIINTQDNEISPYYSHRSKELYFASDFHSGFGGFDIFKSKGSPNNFKAVENVGKGINSSYDDYYFSMGRQIAFFTSDRPQSTKDNHNVCCNDIYYFTDNKLIFTTEEIEKKEVVTTVEEKQLLQPTIVNIDILNRYLPVELYFDNDYPDPNSWDTTTQQNYMLLAEDYLNNKDKYLREYANLFDGNETIKARERMSGFFEEKVAVGMEKLQFFMPLLLEELKKGSKVEMNIKGYASSISASDYNLKLAARRIESLINYLKAYENGILKEYINKTAENGGELNFIKLAFGDYVNSNEEELKGKMGIYSPQAASNRKIEILAVTESAEGRKALDGSEVQLLPKIKLNASSYELKIKEGTQIAPVFNISNSGNGLLKVYAVDVNCDCAQIEYPSQLKPGEEARIRVNIDTKGLKGKKIIELLLISNAIPNLEKLQIQLLIE